MSVTIILILATLWMPRAVGQSTDDYLPALPLLPPAEFPEDVDAASQNVAASDAAADLTVDPATEAYVSPSSPREEVHWIVSVRHCPRNRVDCGECCPFQYSFSNWCGQPSPSSEPEFRRWLTPGIPVCIMVHGSFVSDETVPEDSMRTVHWLRNAAPQFGIQLVFFSWSSEGILTLDPTNPGSSALPGIDVAILGRRAELNGLRLARLVQMIPPECPVCLIGHSHGARMVASTLHLLGGGRVRGHRLCHGPRHRVRAIMAAAAMDHDWFNPGQRFDCGFRGAECVLNLTARHDWALAFYPLRKPFSQESLGRVGFTDKDHRRLGVHAVQAQNCDVSSLIGSGHIWPKYYERPEIAAAIVPWVYFTL